MNSQTTLNKLILGTWAIGGDNKISNMSLGWDNLSNSKISAILNESIQQGFTAFDTSDFYSNGDVERLLGNTFAKERENIYFATKGGIIPEFTKNYGQLKKDFSVEYLRKALDKSLQNLSTNYIDLYQLHGASYNVMKDEKLLLFLQEIKNKGIVKKIGISLSSKDIILNLEEFSQYKVIDYIQLPYTLTNPKMIISINEWRKQNNNHISLIGRSIFKHGILAKNIPKLIVNNCDHRSRKYNKSLIDNINNFKKLLKNELNLSILEASLYYSFSSPFINHLILGATNKVQIIEWVSILNKLKNEKHKDKISERILSLAHQSFH